MDGADNNQDLSISFVPSKMSFDYLQDVSFAKIMVFIAVCTTKDSHAQAARFSCCSFCVAPPSWWPHYPNIGLFNCRASPPHWAAFALPLDELDFQFL
jgi:hypothetical protein